MSENAPVRMGVSDHVTVIVPKNNPLYARFADNNDKPIGHWALELRSNPDQNGEPFIALVKKTLPPGKKRVNGIVGGVFNKATSGFQLTLSSTSAPQIIEKFGHFRTTAVEVSSGSGELVLKLPRDRQAPILRGEKRLEALTAPPVSEPESPTPILDSIVEEAASQDSGVHMSHEPRVGIDAMEAILGRMKQPDKMMLQFPERPLTVERCVNFLNQRVKSQGIKRLRLMLDQETGMISYIEKGGPAY